MALQTQIVTVPLVGGIAQQTDPKSLPQNKLLTCVNGEFEKNAEIRKRSGFTALSTLTTVSASITSGARLGTYRNELTLTDGDSLWTYSKAVDRWAYKDQVPGPTVTRQSVAQPTGKIQTPDIAYCNGYIAFCWLGNITTGLVGDVFARILDASTGAVVFSGQITNSAISFAPRLVAVGTQLVVVWPDNAFFIRAKAFDTTATTFGATSALVSDYGGGALSGMDIGPLSTTRWLLVYPKIAAPPNVSVSLYDASLTLITNAVPAGVVGQPFVFAIKGTVGEVIFLGYEYFTGGVDRVVVMGFDPVTLATTFGPTTASVVASSSPTVLNMGVERVTATTCVLAWTSGVHPTTAVITQMVDSGTGAVGNNRFTLGAFLGSKPFAYNGKTYATIYPDTTLQGTQFVADLRTDDVGSDAYPVRPVATIAPRRSTSAVSTIYGAMLTSTAQVSVGNYVTTGTVVESSSILGRFGIIKVDIGFNDPHRWQSLEVGDNAHLTGGVPCFYDGNIVGEIGFLQYPEPVYTIGHGGGSNAAGDYLYSCHWEYIDAAGQAHRSAPSPPTLVTIALATDYAIITLPSLTLTMRNDLATGAVPSVYLAVHRSTVGGSVLYRRTADVVPAGYNNVPTNQLIVINDGMKDDGTGGTLPLGVPLASRPVIYTTGGVLPNFCPSSASIAVTHKNRLWLAGCDDPKLIWFSKSFTTGEAIAFNDLFTLTIDDGGPITALASQDGYLIAFKRNRIFIIEGDGPSDTGQFSDLQSPRSLATDLGCIDHRSIATTPEGTWFLSELGLCLFDRTQQVTFGGRPVEDTIAKYPVTSATVHHSKGQVRFTNSDGTNGEWPVYDYVQHEWSTFQVLGNVAAVSAANWFDGTQWNWVCLLPSGTVLVESTSLYTDIGNYVSMTVEFESTFQAMASFKRVRRASVIGIRQGNYDLTVSVAAENTAYGAAFTNTVTWPYAVTSSLPRQEYVVHVAQQKCEAIRVRVVDTTPTGASVGGSRGFTINALAFEIGIKQGSPKTGKSQRG